MPSFILARQARATGSEALLRTMLTRGEITRLRSGTYVRASEFAALTADDLYRFRVHAAARALLSPAIFSHDSAAVLWGLPSLGRWSPRIHVLDAHSPGGRSHSDIRRHCLGADAAACEIEGLAVTSLARTLIDQACSTNFSRAVGMVDSGLRPPDSHASRTRNPGSNRAPELGSGSGSGRRMAQASPWRGNVSATKEELLNVLDDLLPYPGSARARKVIEFADGTSDSLLESISRTQMMLLGLPAPQLQVPFYDAEGFIGYADFYWPELDLIGESDGDLKYDGKDSPSGESAETVVKKEKRREDRMRRVVSGFVRWDWAVARDRQRLAERLRPYGLAENRRRSR